MRLEQQTFLERMTEGLQVLFLPKPGAALERGALRIVGDPMRLCAEGTQPRFVFILGNLSFIFSDTRGETSKARTGRNIQRLKAINLSRRSKTVDVKSHG